MEHLHQSTATDHVLMQHEEQAILVIASRVLSYPPDPAGDLVDAIYTCIDEQIESSAMQNELKSVLHPLFAMSVKDLKELYVSTFDLKSKLGLYLTAHEFGDSPKRGAALIKLQKIVNKAGYEREGDELGDYIPMLLELLAVSPELTQNTRLYKRLAVAIQRILNHIEPSNPYTGIFQVLMTYLFPEPTKEDIEELEFNREEADMEELPFPIMYQ